MTYDFSEFQAPKVLKAKQLVPGVKLAVDGYGTFKKVVAVNLASDVRITLEDGSPMRFELFDDVCIKPKEIQTERLSDPQEEKKFNDFLEELYG